MVFSGTTTRRKIRNIARDPRVSLTLFDIAAPYRTVEIRGTVRLADGSYRAGCHTST